MQCHLLAPKAPHITIVLIIHKIKKAPCGAFFILSGSLNAQISVLLLQSNLCKSFIQVFAGSGIFISLWCFVVNTAFQTGQTHIAFWMQKKRDGITAGVPQLPRRVYHAVRSGAQLVVGKPLQHIAHIYHNLLGQGSNANPIALFGYNL